ncbi:MAG: NTPase [Promethearchaeati archaeon SRVP18_Atabeyarchaeia-1]
MLLKKANIIVTGPPGSGKTRLIQRIVEDLKNQGVAVGGLLTPEIRVGTERTGFHIVDIMTGEKGLMADASLSSDVNVGRYGVNIDVIKEIGVNALTRAMSRCEVVVIDEIGKMELYSKEFQDVVEQVLLSEKPMIGTIGEKLRHPFTMKIKAMPSVKVMTLTRSNWDETYRQIKEMLSPTADQ